MKIEKPCSICDCGHPHECSCIILEGNEIRDEYSKAFRISDEKIIKRIHCFRDGKEIETVSFRIGCLYCYHGKEPGDPVCPTCKRFLDLDD